MKKTIPPKEGRRWPGYILWGRVRTSTVALIIVFIGCWWLYETYDTGPDPSQVPASNVVPPGFIPDPAYTWVPRTDVQRPDLSTTTMETTPTTPTTSTTPTTATTPTTPGADGTATDTPTSGAPSGVPPTPTTNSTAPPTTSAAPTSAGAATTAPTSSAPPTTAAGAGTARPGGP